MKHLQTHSGTCLDVCAQYVSLGLQSLAVHVFALVFLPAVQPRQAVNKSTQWIVCQVDVKGLSYG